MNMPTDLGKHARHLMEAAEAGARAHAGGERDDEGDGESPPSVGSPGGAADESALERTATEAPPSPKKTSRSRRGRELDVETALGRLSHQHRELARLFKKLDREATKSGRRLVFSQLSMLLSTHRMLEEQHFYPELREVLGDAPEAEEIGEALRELDEVRRMAEDIPSIDVTDPLFGERVMALRERVELHMEEMEATLFPRAEQALGSERLRSIGGAMSRSLTELEERARRAAEEPEVAAGHGEEAPPR